MEGQVDIPAVRTAPEPTIPDCLTGWWPETRKVQQRLLAPIVWSYLTLSPPVALGHTLAPSPHKSQNLNFTFFVPSLGTLKHYKIIFLINRVRKMSPLRGHEPKFLHLNKAKNWLNSESSPVVERGHSITSTLPRDLIVSSFPVYLLERHFIKSSKVGPVQ